MLQRHWDYCANGKKKLKFHHFLGLQTSEELEKLSLFRELDNMCTPRSVLFAFNKVVKYVIAYGKGNDKTRFNAIHEVVRQMLEERGCLRKSWWNYLFGKTADMRDGENEL